MATRKRKQTPAQVFGRRGGQAGTKAQDKARRRNGKLGGRPSRVCCFCAEPVLGGHKDRRLDDSCGAHGWQWRKSTDDPDAAVIDLLEQELARHQQAVIDLQKQLTRLR